MTGAAQLTAHTWVTDGGLETDLIFHHGIDLPLFAAFPLVDDPPGRDLLQGYYSQYASVAAAAGAGLMLETPTWRANPDWGAQLDYDQTRLDAVNQRAAELLRGVGERSDVEVVLVSGVLGPRGDGYVAGGLSVDQAADYHATQVRSLARAGVDVVHAMTLTEPAEAIGVVRAARAEGVPVAISFTVETDGRLPDGTPLQEAIATVDAAGGPDWYGLNCAHPTHVAPALDHGVPDEATGWRDRIAWFRPNASTLSHEELDAMTELDDGDLTLLTRTADEIRSQLPALRVVGGCCGTDVRHVAALWGVTTPG